LDLAGSTIQCKTLQKWGKRAGKLTQGQIIGYFTFNSDMSFGGRVEESGVTTWKYRGTWSFKNNAIDYRYTFSSSDQIKVGARDHDEILEIGCDQIKIKSMMGQTGVFQRNDRI